MRTMLLSAFLSLAALVVLPDVTGSSAQARGKKRCRRAAVAYYHPAPAYYHPVGYSRAYYGPRYYRPYYGRYYRPYSSRYYYSPYYRYRPGASFYFGRSYYPGSFYGWPGYYGFRPRGFSFYW